MLRDLVATTMQRNAQRAAVVDGTQRITYGDLLLSAELFAGHAYAQTGAQEPRIAVLLNNRWEYFAIDLACAFHGAVLVRLNARDSASDIAYILGDSNADLLIIDAEHEGVAKEALTHLERNPPVILVLPKHGEADGVPMLRDLLVPAAPASTVLRPESLYRLMYTSGSTGKPKGVMVTADQWSSAVIEHLLMHPLRDVPTESTLLHVTPLSHVSGGLFWPFSLLSALHVIAPTAATEDISEACERYDVTHTFLVPTLVNRVLDELPASRDHVLRALERIYYAASPIDPERLGDALKRFGSVFAQGYGSTEAMWWLTFMSPAEHTAAIESGQTSRLASCGRPSLGVPIAVLDDDGQHVKQGELGEIATRGRHVGRDYLNIGPIPREVRTPDGEWFRTGDVGFQDAEGYVHLMDRKGDLIITGGFNVYPREVEIALAGHPAVAECVVVGAPDDRWGEAVTAIVVRRNHAAVTEAEILDYTRSHLTNYKLPRAVEFVDALPETSAGKVDRKAIRARYWQGLGRSI